MNLQPIIDAAAKHFFDLILICGGTVVACCFMICLTIKEIFVNEDANN
jgi:hypothetical protein